MMPETCFYIIHGGEGWGEGGIDKEVLGGARGSWVADTYSLFDYLFYFCIYLQSATIQFLKTPICSPSSLLLAYLTALRESNILIGLFPTSPSLECRFWLTALSSAP